MEAWLHDPGNKLFPKCVTIPNIIAVGHIISTQVGDPKNQDVGARPL